MKWFRRKPRPITPDDAKAALRVMGIVDATNLQADVLARIANGHDPLEAAFFARHGQPESQRREDSTS